MGDSSVRSANSMMRNLSIRPAHPHPRDIFQAISLEGSHTSTLNRHPTIGRYRFYSLTSCLKT
jgi:hypothetical protein